MPEPEHTASSCGGNSGSNTSNNNEWKVNMEMCLMQLQYFRILSLPHKIHQLQENICPQLQGVKREDTSKKEEKRTFFPEKED